MGTDDRFPAKEKLNNKTINFSKKQAAFFTLGTSETSPFDEKVLF